MMKHGQENSRLGKSLLYLLCAATFLWLPSIVCMADTAQSADGVMLAEKGVARAVIVIDAEAPSQKPNLKTAEAVAGLKSSLEAVTGAKFTVKTAGTEAPGESCIYVGDCAAKKLGVDPAKLGEDEWIVKAGDGKVCLTGGNWLGTSNAIWRFLEDGVGIRFWSAWEKDVPKRADLVVAPLDRRGTPAFSFSLDKTVHPSQGLNAQEYSQIVQRTAHGTMLVVPAEKYFDQHPEWYAEVDGKRQKFQAAAVNKGGTMVGDYCMTAAGLADEYAVQLGKTIDAKRAEAAQKGTRAPSVYAMGREDNAPWCQCEKCQAVVKESSRSDLYMAFVNQVAERIAKTHPDVLLLYSAYLQAAPLPKKEKARDNVLVWYSTEPMDFSKSINDPANTKTREAIKGWSEAARHLGIWHYVRSYDRFRGKYEVCPDLGASVEYPIVVGFDWPLATVQIYPEFLQFLKQSNVGNVYFPVTDSFLTRDAQVLKTWVQAKLLADPAQDVGALVKTFTDGYYGPAGADVWAYLDLLERRQKELPPKIYFFADLKAYKHLTLETCLEADRILADAEKKVGQAQPFLDRIRFLRASTMDRVLAFKWNNFVRQWKLQGKSAESFPINQAELLERAAQAGKWYGGVRGKENAPRFITASRKWVEFARNQLMTPINLPVPEKFSTLPPEAVWQFPAQSYAFDRTGQKTARLNDDFGEVAEVKDNALLVPDAAVAGGQALSIAGPAPALEWAFIRTWGGYDPGSASKAPVADLEGAYRWIKLGTYDFSSVNSGVAFTFGTKKWKFYALDLDPGKYDVWLNLRFDRSSGTLYIERLVAVSVKG